MVDGSGIVSAGDGAIPGGGSVGTSGAGGAGEGEAVAAPSNWVKEGAVGSLPNGSTWRRPDDPVGDWRMLSGLPGTAAGLCFFLRNSSLRLAFLLMVDGLFFFQALSLVTEVGAISQRNHYAHSPAKQFYVFLATAPTGVLTAGTAGLL